MSLLKPEDIPGYADAVRNEARIRDIAFLAWPIPLCGVKVRQFTPRHLILLDHCQNAFVCGQQPALADILEFMWFVSVDYSLDHAERDRFLVSWQETASALKPIEEINEYLADAFHDAPMRQGGGMAKAYTAPMAAIVDILASSYGWDDDKILEMPIARVFQYLRRIQKRTNPNTILFNRSDKAISDWQARMQLGSS